MANDEDVARLQQEEVDVWNDWRARNPCRMDLSRASLWGADLSEADLSEANLSEANLSLVDLSRANLGDADLGDADLGGADQVQLSPCPYLGGQDFPGASSTVGEKNVDCRGLPFAEFQVTVASVMYLKQVEGTG